MRLHLRKETLAALGDDDLALVAGGTVDSNGPICVSEPSNGAICVAEPSGRLFNCESWFSPCVSNTCTI